MVCIISTFDLMKLDVIILWKKEVSPSGSSFLFQYFKERLTIHSRFSISFEFDCPGIHFILKERQRTILFRPRCPDLTTKSQSPVSEENETTTRHHWSKGFTRGPSLKDKVEVVGMGVRLVDLLSFFSPTRTSKRNC